MMNEDNFRSCPYNKSHRIARKGSRFQKHLCICPDKTPDFEICPYNASHRVLKTDLLEHMKKCDTAYAALPPGIGLNDFTSKHDDNEFLGNEPRAGEMLQSFDKNNSTPSLPPSRQSVSGIPQTQFKIVRISDAHNNHDEDSDEFWDN
ncbi:unnamed protein product [Leptosia nina]|uniref:CHHC U11-48K-type domain-containing protein n=1 Tax=Leptosia nina TaxID=320188 RepID=A0AAV1IX01_9NEOP